MKYALPFILALLVAPVAHAGQITFNVQTATINTSAGDEIADSDVARIFAAFRTMPSFNQIQDTNTDGTPKVDDNGNPVLRTTTDAEVALLIMRRARSELLTTTQRIEAAEAAAAVQPIQVTPLQ